MIDPAKFKEVHRQETVFMSGRTFGVRVLVATSSELSEKCQREIRRHGEAIIEAMETDAVLSDPQTEILKAENRAVLEQVFTDAGLAPIYMEAIPNAYCPRSCCFHRPWFIITTSIGRMTVGWRKSVIHLEWTDSEQKRTAEELFPDEDVTRYERVIHAWGYEKLTKYLSRIANGKER